MQANEVIDDLLAVRESRRTAALVKYRGMVEMIAAGESMLARLGTAYLGVSDDLSAKV